MSVGGRQKRVLDSACALKENMANEFYVWRQSMEKNQVLHILSEHKNELNSHGVKAIALFGSVARGEATIKSDVDILVEFDRIQHKPGLFAFVRLRRRLEELLGAKVDLVTPNALKKQMKDKILE